MTSEMNEFKHTHMDLEDIDPVVVDGGKNSTRQLSEDEMAFDAHEQYLDQLYRQYNIKVDNALLFYIDSDPEPMIFVDKKEINIGRQDSAGRIVPEMDLSEHGASERGISRLHAQIKFKNGVYLIQDLHSTNGTWLNGNKLVPYQRYELKDGDMVQLGRLMTRVFVIQRN